ncbi:hypothetical protein ACFQ2Y_02045 [Streptomyces malaysiensis subsp. malaysiensis]
MDFSLSGSAAITWSQGSEFRSMVMLGYFFSNALTTSFIQALSGSPVK